MRKLFAFLLALIAGGEMMFANQVAENNMRLQKTLNEGTRQHLSLKKDHARFIASRETTRGRAAVPAQPTQKAPQQDGIDAYYQFTTPTDFIALQFGGGTGDYGIHLYDANSQLIAQLNIKTDSDNSIAGTYTIGTNGGQSYNSALFQGGNTFAVEYGVVSLKYKGQSPTTTEDIYEIVASQLLVTNGNKIISYSFSGTINGKAAWKDYYIDCNNNGQNCDIARIPLNDGNNKSTFAEVNVINPEVDRTKISTDGYWGIMGIGYDTKSNASVAYRAEMYVFVHGSDIAGAYTASDIVKLTGNNNGALLYKSTDNGKNWSHIEVKSAIVTVIKMQHNMYEYDIYMTDNSNRVYHFVMTENVNTSNPLVYYDSSNDFYAIFTQEQITPFTNNGYTGMEDGKYFTDVETYDTQTGNYAILRFYSKRVDGVIRIPAGRYSIANNKGENTVLASFMTIDTQGNITDKGGAQCISDLVVQDKQRVSGDVRYIVSGTVDVTESYGQLYIEVNGYNSLYRTIHFTIGTPGIPTSGTCGVQDSNLTWNLSEDGVMTISGTGDMTDYEKENTPWFGIRKDIHTVIIKEGVNKIGNYAFYDCINLASLTLPCSIKSIGINAFTENITIIKNCGVKKNETTLTLCEGEKLVWHNTNIEEVKPSDSGDYEYKTKTILYDDSIAILHLTVESAYNIKLNDTVLCYKDELIIGGTICPLSKKANTKQTWTQNLKTANGCDSTITISVTWKKLPDFTITAKDVYDTPHSGSISYTQADANYSGDYYCTLNGNTIVGSINNLSEGNFRLVFYSMDECEDSIVKNIQINKYGMRINGIYYLLDEKEHTAEVTFQGTSYTAYSDEYSGHITIPETVTFDGKEYQVTGFGSNAFSGCSTLKSITMESKTPVSMPYNCGLSNNVVIYVPYGSLNAYKNSSNWNFHVVNPSHVTTISGATSVRVNFGDSDEQKHIISCGIEGGEANGGGYVLEYSGLKPKSEYTNVPFIVNTKEGDHDILYCSFTTSALTLNTLASKAVSDNTAILLAETNMSDAETSCGFEWRRNDAPTDMASNQVICPVANGQLAGRLKGLKDDVYYKYRAFYKSIEGKMYYGEWQYIFTGDATVEYDPVLYTYAPQSVSERKVTLKGYALAGSDDFTEQGFEYWAESRNKSNAPRRAPQDVIGEKHMVAGSGISMQVTLENLDEGTVYQYRTYAKTGNKTLYGSEMTFTTDGEWIEYTIAATVNDATMGTVTGGGSYHIGSEITLEAIAKNGYDFVQWSDGNTDNPRTVTVIDNAEYTAVFKAKNPSSLSETESENAKVRKYISNGILYIERNGIRYTAQGQRLD